MAKDVNVPSVTKKMILKAKERMFEPEVSSVWLILITSQL